MSHLPAWNRTDPGLLRWWPAGAGFLLFLLLGALVLPYPGLQNDEALFAEPLYQIAGVLYSVRLGHHDVAVMLLSYLGALKTWLYAPILKHWRPSIYSIRWPVLAASAYGTILLFRIARSVHSTRAAAVASLLLATDASYVLTTVFDWGPVALQHLLLLAVTGLGWRFARQNRLADLGLASFFTGLALWDKALFLWPFGGIVVALVAVFPREIWRRVNGRNVGVALACFVLGAWPLIQYNRTHHWDTFRSNSHFSLDGAVQKFTVLRATADGSALFGYLVNEREAGSQRAPQSGRERFSAWLRGCAGEHRRGAFNWAFLAALALTPWLWLTRARRLLSFLLIAMAVGWLQMAITRQAGGSVHHAILLWPMPTLFVAVAFAEATARWRRGVWVLGGVVAFLVVANLLNFNQYLDQFARFGAAGSWDDGILTLSQRVDGYRAPQLYVTDWGILTPLVVLHRGSLPLDMATDALMSDQPTPDEMNYERRKLVRTDAVWLGHVRDQEQFQGVGARLDRIAGAQGLRKQILDTIHDRNGRPVLEVFRFAPAAQ